MNKMLDKKLNIIISGSFLLKSIFVFFFHEQNLSAEWAILFSNFQNFGSYSYYVFNNEGMPSSYMPPLYFLFLYINKIISFDLINFLYLVFLIKYCYQPSQFISFTKFVITF